MATTTSDDGFHEIQLNGKQLVFLFMAVTVASVIIFLCGVLVGRGVRMDRGSDALASGAPGARIQEPPVAAAPAQSSGAAPSAAEDLSYPKRLASNDPTPERLSAPEPSPPSARAPQPDAGPTTEPAVATPAPAPSARTAAAPAASAEPAGEGYAIQVAALRQRAEADGVVRSLLTKGYSAYVMAPDPGAPAVFRVRVGKFKDRREAESVAARLQKEEQFKPWIVR
jgi:cell division septation protein DedD